MYRVSEPEELTDLDGIGEKTASKIKSAGITSIDDLMNASALDLLEIEGVGKQKLRSIRNRLSQFHDPEQVFRDSVFLKDNIESDEESVQTEVDLIWREDPREHEFVREKFRRSYSRNEPHEWGQDNSHFTIVGYSILHPKTPSDSTGNYRRRIFFLKPQDFDSDGEPIEAVSPESIEIGELGLHPDEDLSEYDRTPSLSGSVRPDHGEVDTSASPEHDVPFIESHDERRKLLREGEHSGVPAMFIRKIDLEKWCFIAVQMPWMGNDYLCLTDDAISRINRVLDDYEDEIRPPTGGIYPALSVSKSDYIELPHMQPNTAREVADILYPIITDKSNLELHWGRVDFELDGLDWYGEKTDDIFYCQSCGDVIRDVDVSKSQCNECLNSL